MPKGKGNTDIHARLKKKSPWFTSILDPLAGATAKIPDETGVDTGTIQIVQRAVVKTNSNGITGLQIVSPYVNSNALSEGGDGANFTIVDPATVDPVTETTVRWGGGAIWDVDSSFPFDGVEELKQITNMHRIVSACLIVQPEPSLATDKGEFSLFAVPFNSLTTPLYNDYMNRYKSVVVPVNCNKPAMVRWYPVVREDWSFKSFVRTNGTDSSPDDDTPAAYPNWSLGFISAGCEEGINFRVTMVVNYEFIPANNTLNVLGATPSPQDATETDLVENWTQSMAVATPMSSTAAAKSPTNVPTPEPGGGTGFGMFFEVVKELAPLALALL